MYLPPSTPPSAPPSAPPFTLRCLPPQVIMLVQTDVTARVELENKLADLTDAQLSMLEQLFPRHIIEHLLASVVNKGDRNLRDLANMHEQVCSRGGPGVAGDAGDGGSVGGRMGVLVHVRLVSPRGVGSSGEGGV